MTCKFCNQFWDRFWEWSDAWEREHSNDAELWAEESDQSLKLIDNACAIQKSAPSAAFRLFLKAADAGSVWSMERVAWHYDTGTGVPADFGKAQEYYYRALSAGSWMATINYAQLLAEHGYYDDCDRVLEDGVSSDFVPAYFWLARLRYEHSKDGKVCREVRPMLEYAAKKGHPAAEMTLARWMLLGKLGIREVFGGLKLTLQSAIRWATRDQQPKPSPLT